MTTPGSTDDVRWSLDRLFAGLDADDYRRARADLDARVAALERTLAEQGIGSGPPLATDEADLDRLAGILDALNDLAERLSDVDAFLTGHTAVDAFDDLAQAESSTRRALQARIRAASARITAWLGRLDLERAIAAHPTAAAHAHHLRRQGLAARHLMSDPEEDLAAALGPAAGAAWGKLRDDLAGRASVDVLLPNAPDVQAAGLAQLHIWQADADRAVRAEAYRAELRLLDTHAVAFAAAMNGVKGEVATLAARRGWASPLQQALHDNGLTPRALDAMQTSVREAFPTLRRYLRAKARFLGLERLAWYDLNAPVQAGSARRFTWAEATEFILERFTEFGPTLAALARRAFDEGWIDVAPRAGKGNGAFCMRASGARESRIMLNFGGDLDDVFTLAHELGHAFHNDAAYRAGRRPLQSVTPMTLAETASIFCETLATTALLETADDATRLAVLEQDLRGTTQLLIDIDGRFRFESEVFERRAQRELSIAELDAAMVAAQEATYGDALDPEARHPRMWAQKGHYYSASRSFYNFPYTFGYLFGLGVHARYRTEPEGFVARYEALLVDTGMDDVVSLGRRFGIDVEEVAFWRDALAPMQARVEAYEHLVADAAT
jgi:oligoendopeptidase F